MKKEDISRLDRFLNGEGNCEDQERVEQLLGSVVEDDEVREYVENDWNQYPYSEKRRGNHLDRILDGVHHEIHLNANKEKRKTFRRMYRWYSAVAAIVLLPLLTAGVIAMVEMGKMEDLLSEKSAVARIASPMGSRLSFQLPDGSTGFLNGGASIEYAIPFSANRKVRLMGEAYFHVKRDEKHCFVVHANLMDVKVLGTRFNVKADVDYAEVVLEKGKVECFVGKKKKSVMLKPTERIRVSGGRVERSNVDVSRYTAWKDGQLVFKGDSMKEVAQKISQWFNVDVDLKGEVINGYFFRGTFEDDSLEEVLRLLKLTSPLDYKIEKRKRLPDGSYSRKRVVVYHRKKK